MQKLNCLQGIRLKKVSNEWKAAATVILRGIEVDIHELDKQITEAM